MIDFRNYLRVVYSNRTCDRVYILLINMKNIPYDLVCASSYTPKKESLIRYPFCFASQALMSLLWLHAFPLPSSLALAFSIVIVYISQHLFNTPLVLAQQTIVQFFSCVHLFFCWALHDALPSFSLSLLPIWRTTYIHGIYNIYLVRLLLR